MVESSDKQEKISKFGIWFIGLYVLIIAALFVYILGMVVKSETHNLTNFIQLGTIKFILVIVFVLFSLLVVAKKLFIKYDIDFKYVKNLNLYLLGAVLMMFFFLSSASIIADELVPKNFYFEKHVYLSRLNNVSEQLDIGTVGCLSEKHMVAVKGDDWRCSFNFSLAGFVNKSEYNNLSFSVVEINVFEYEYEFKEGQNILNSSFGFFNDTEISQRFYIELRDNKTVFLDVVVYTNEVSLNGEYSYSYDLISQEVAVQNENNRTNNVYTILLFSVSFAFFSVIVGMNNLKQLIEGNKCSECNKKK